MNTRMTVPIRGTVIDYNSKQADFDNVGIAGAVDDPVVLAVDDLGDVSWQMLSIDLINGTAEIEITGSDEAVQTAQDRILNTAHVNSISVGTEILVKCADHL